MAEADVDNDKVMERNAKSAGTQVKWASTKIIERDELRASNPLAALLARDTKQRQQQVRRGSGRSYAMDADTSIVLRFLDLDTTVEEAVTQLSQSLAMRQKDRTQLGFWAGLRTYLSSMPAGSRIADCNTVLLARGLANLESNVA
jgi:hypothetical protein